MKDDVRAYLLKRGCSSGVVDRGLPGLVEKWEMTVRAVESGYSLTLDDYLNDMDARQLISDLWNIASDHQRAQIAPRLRQSDESMRRVTRPTPVCLWGKDAAKREGWQANENWWYFAHPTHGGPEFLREIEALIKQSGL